MNETTGRTYLPSSFIKALTAGQAKNGKTTFLVAQLLGVFPGQQFGGVVTSPRHLHVIALDEDALAGLTPTPTNKGFLLSQCGAPDECLDFNVYPLQEEARKTCAGIESFQAAFYNALETTRLRITEKIQRLPGVHATVMSSFTTMARAIETEVRGPPPWSAQYGQDWNMLNAQMNRLQNNFQMDAGHMFWEGHITYVPAEGAKDMKKTVPKLSLHGRAGQEWANNTSHNLLIKREAGQKVVKNGVKTEVDKAYLEVKGGGTDFLTGGRRVAGLDPQETDLTVALKKMGYRVGQWGWKGKK
jgi:hypothetical protein